MISAINTFGVVASIRSMRAEVISCHLERVNAITERYFMRRAAKQDEGAVYGDFVWEESQSEQCFGMNKNNVRLFSEDDVIAYIEDICSDNNRGYFKTTIFLSKKDGTPVYYQ